MAEQEPKSPKVTFGDKPVLGSTPVRWSFTEGTFPYETTIDMMPEDVKALLGNNGQNAKTPQTLVMDPGNGEKPVTIKNVFVLGQVAGDNPHIAKIRIADRRWLLPYFNFLGRFNMRRNVGFYRAANNPSTPQLNPVLPRVWYWRWSLKNPDAGTRWKLSECIEEFMTQLEQFETENGYMKMGWTIEHPVKQQDNRVDVDNLNLDDSGEAALSRLVGMYPSAGVYVNADGKYVFFDRNDPDDPKKNAPEQLKPIIVGSGQFHQLDNSLVRPSKIEVFFTMEVEVRHDFIGNLSTVTEDTRWLENVIPVPDFEVEIQNVSYPQNSWVPLQQVIRCPAWSSAPGIGGPISSELLEKAAMPYLDLWGALLLTGVRDPDKDWAARVSALQAHNRKTFQLNANWMHRTLAIKARRATVINPVTGTWAPSEVFCDHSFLGTVRSFFKNMQNGGKDLAYAINVKGYPQGSQVPGTSTPSGALKFEEDSKAAPVIVHILDGDQGIIHLNFQADPNHMFEAALPGIVVKADNTEYSPTANWKDPAGQQSISFDSVTSRTQVPKLKNNWKCCVILTHVPASPNNKTQLYKITVEPDTVKNMLGKAGESISKSNGPIWQIRVGAGMDGGKALVRWVDDRALDIERIFGLGDGTPPNLEGLVANHSKSGNKYDISLQKVAEALAAQVYSRFVDHPIGSAAGYLNPDVTIGGWTEQVTHTVQPNGVMTTDAVMRPQPVEINFTSLLDSSTRAVLLKLPHVERQ